jgi:hypothetical protein
MKHKQFTTKPSQQFSSVSKGKGLEVRLSRDFSQKNAVQEKVDMPNMPEIISQ